jgi:hypothetical protein
MTNIRRFHWAEPFAFARARANTFPGGNNLFQFAFYLVLFIALLGIKSFPHDLQGVAKLLVFSCAASFVFAYPINWIIRRTPNSILVAEDRIFTGRNSIPMSQVDYALVGTAQLAGSQHRVLTFRTISGESHMYGIGKKIDSNQLAEFLKQLGVREPQA